ncbi:Macrolide-efflux protein [Roseomonas mucosa]|mgnify:FL=1|uniref:Macrolide-efflux protein n=2 Tax=Roseomonas TaxID=125216 RepID=A0A4Y1N0K4_9PROT|nr:MULTISPECIES: MFS transporter [Roseomonas]AWV23711.1 Macrolide-efflux protein [Roseomonas mucosa]MDT8276390.1 MFS transporter [Roseomonas mucosa]MDT8353373.1 MFS transporter [Roseomonas mucosa]USQ72087.1 MFS transporter [Roseomonas mucosa]UZO97979.1 Macrolide-efflux protein [Roseomonas mucosa]
MSDAPSQPAGDGPLNTATAPSAAQAEAASPLLRNRSFLLFWVTRVSSALAFQVIAVSVGWQVYALTGSTFALGMVGLAQFVPQMILTLPAGHIADQYDRRHIMRACQLAEALAGLTLAATALAGHTPTWLVFVAVAAVGAARAFESPATTSLLPGLVPSSQLQQAISLTSSAMQTAMILGPALGGLLYALGAGLAYSIVTALFLTAALATTLIRLDHTPPRREPLTLANAFAGIGFIRTRPILLGVITLDLFAVLLGGAVALLPVYAKEILHTGPWGLGLLRSSPAIGALAMSLLLARFPMRHHAGLKMFGAVGVFGLATVVFGLSTWLPLSVAALVVLGAADVVSVVIRSALVQFATPDHMRGRVNAMNMLFIGASNQLGEFESGVTAALLGTVPAVVLGGIGSIVIVLLWMRVFPALRRVDNLEALSR